MGLSLHMPAWSGISVVYNVVAFVPLWLDIHICIHSQVLLTNIYKEFYCRLISGCNMNVSFYSFTRSN